MKKNLSKVRILILRLAKRLASITDAKVRRFSSHAKKIRTFFIDMLRHRPRSATESGNEPFSMSQKKSPQRFGGSLAKLYCSLLRTY